jgi:hypothetical protein
MRTDGQAGRHDDVESCFPQFCKRAYKRASFCHSFATDPDRHTTFLAQYHSRSYNFFRLHVTSSLSGLNVFPAPHSQTPSDFQEQSFPCTKQKVQDYTLRFVQRLSRQQTIRQKTVPCLLMSWHPAKPAASSRTPTSRTTNTRNTQYFASEVWRHMWTIYFNVETRVDELFQRRNACGWAILT